MQDRSVYSFGPFELDAGARRLTRDREPVALADRQFEILQVLVARAGQIVAKDTLIEAAWKDVAVSDNSLEQAISNLRRILGPAPDGASYIETLARRGYRFSAHVTRSTPRETDEALDSLLAPYRVFVEGRAAVETLEVAAVARARQAFAQAVAGAPDFAPGHLGLANVLTLGFEATRAGETPDVAALGDAVRHARDACRLDSTSGEAWATLAFVLSRMGADTEAAAAGHRAVALEPDNWRHWIRLAYATWGEARLRAAHHAARLLPDLALAHLLAATVLVSRQAFDEATRELEAGTAAQARQQNGPFGAAGLHLILGLVRLASGDESGAEASLGQELAREHAGHIYTRQACATTSCAMGAIQLRRSQTPAAVSAFEHALDLLPGYVPALAALSVVAEPDRRMTAGAHLDRRMATLAGQGATIEIAMANAITHALSGRHHDAAGRIHEALLSVPTATSAGWTVPVEPLLRIDADRSAWGDVLALVRSRAA